MFPYYESRRAGGRGYGSYDGDYLLDDEFSDTLVAGAVNGTPATPGPGIRTVRDVENKIAIAGGTANFTAQVTPVSAEQDLIYANIPITRVPGRVLLSSVSVTTAGYLYFIVWTDSTTPTWVAYANFIHGLWYNALVVQIDVGDNAGTRSIATLSLATAYPMALVLRAIGCHFFRKVSGVWILLWSSSASAATPLYAAVSGYTGVFKEDYIRIPAQLWTPTPLASDSFNRANGSLHNSLTDGLAVEEAGGAGKVWTAPTWTIAGNVALNTPTFSGADVIINGIFDHDDHWTHGLGWSIALGVASIAGAASTDETQTVAPLTIHTWYQVVWTNTAITAGSIRAVLGTNVTAIGAAAATYTMTQVANGTAFAMRGVAATADIDNVTCTPITMADLFATVPCPTSDVLVELPITEGANNLGGRQTGIVTNLDNPAAPANFRITYLNGNGGVQVDEYVAGVRTAKLAATAVVYAAGAKAKVVTQGTSLAAYYNEAQVGATQTMAANTATNHGMMSTSSVPSVNNCAVFARGTGGEYATLDQF